MGGNTQANTALPAKTNNINSSLLAMPLAVPTTHGLVRRSTLNFAPRQRNVTMMASKHGGLSKDDKDFLRKTNEKLFESGEGQNLRKGDLKNPSLRVAMQKGGANTLKKNQYQQILEQGQKSNYQRVEQLALQFGLPESEATHLASVSKLENKLAKH